MTKENKPKFEWLEEPVSKKLTDYSEEEQIMIAHNIGELLMRMPAIARHLRHRNPLNTLRDYTRESNDPLRNVAREYLLDLLQKPWGGKTTDLLAKWGAYPESFAAEDMYTPKSV